MPGLNLNLLVKKEELDDSFLCCFCNLLLKEPLQLQDGRRICRTCFQDFIESQVEKPDDKEGNGVDAELGNQDYFVDRFAWNYIKNMDIVCQYKENGCKWVGKVSEFEAHSNSCDRNLTVNDMDTPYFNAEGAKMNNRPKENGRSIFVEPKFHDHCEIWLDDSEKNCPFNEEGCPQTEVMNKSKLNDHISVNLVTHLFFLLSTVKNIRYLLSNLINSFTNFKSDVITKISHQTVFVAEIESKLIKWTEYVKSQFASIWDKIENISKEVFEIRTSIQNNAHMKNNDVILELENRLVVQQAHINEQNLAMEELNRNFERFRDQLAALRGGYYELKTAQKSKETAGPSLTLPAPVISEDDHLTSYDGVLLWKVGNVMRRRQEAITKKVTSILSPAFYTSKRGYKLCARLYMNGDDQSKGKYMGLFVSVMKGPYDAVLDWPFRKRVTMTLVDQDNMKHHEDSFIPDATSSSFQRPKKDINIASGSPFFFALEALDINGYVKNDTLFIKITVGS